MNLKNTIAFWDQVMTVITFAEANEHEIAQQLVDSKQMPRVKRAEQPLKVIPNTSLSEK